MCWRWRAGSDTSYSNQEEFYVKFAKDLSVMLRKIG